MKGFVAAAAIAAMASGANAHNAHRQAHNLFKKNAQEACTPICRTIVHTITGEATWVPDAPKPTHTPEMVAPPPPPPATTTPTPETTVIPVVPGPELSTCEGPGTYTIPAETMTVTDKVEVCGAASTHLPAGTHTIGEMTTECAEPTTVTYAACTEVNGGEAPTTTHVCPGAGVCTIVPGTVTVIEEGETDVYYPTVSVFEPGTYTRGETVVTVTVDKTVAYCPYKTSEKPQPPKETKAPEPKPEPKPETKTEVKVAAKPSPKPEPEPKPEPTTEYKEAPKPSPKPEPKKETKKPQVSGPGDIVNGNFGPSKDGAYAMTYTPYEASNGNCKSASGVMSDLTILKGMGLDTIRIYSTDCDTYKTVIPAAKKLGLKLVIGVFVKGSCSINSPDIKEQVDTIAAWADWEQVKLFVVGNEVKMSGACSPSELSGLITAVKSRCSGYKGPWTTAEILDSYQNEEFVSAICPLIDVVGANIHPFFNTAISADKAGGFVADQLSILNKVCPGKKAINLECGWPTGGSGCNGAACPGKQEAITALTSIKKAAGGSTCFFSMHDDKWKQGGVQNVEQHWGCPKEVFA